MAVGISSCRNYPTSNKVGSRVELFGEKDRCSYNLAIRPDGGIDITPLTTRYSKCR